MHKYIYVIRACDKVLFQEISKIGFYYYNKTEINSDMITFLKFLFRIKKNLVISVHPNVYVSAELKFLTQRFNLEKFHCNI